MQKMIEAVEVKRADDGFWYHPDLPSFDEGDGDKYNAWLEAQGLKTRSLALEYEDDTHPAYVAYFEKNENSCALWNPELAEGKGWWLLAIGESEDGPVATFARRP